MAELDETPTAPLACEAEAPSLAAPQPVDTRYGYALPGRRWAQVAVSSIVFAMVAIIATMLPQARPAIVSVCIILVPLAYFKAGIGGRELSYRQWLCPLRYGDLPWAYHMAEVTVPFRIVLGAPQGLRVRGLPRVSEGFRPEHPRSAA